MNPVRPIMLLLALGMIANAGAADRPETRGLLMHWDAAGQRAARERASLPPLDNAQPVDLLLDSSANAVLLSQPIPDRRPVLVSDGGSAFLKFDGRDDFLTFQAPGRRLASLTVFVVAAPGRNPGSFSGLLGVGAFGGNDYTSGLNFDFGPAPTTNLSVLNVESAGAGGFRDLLAPGFLNAAERPFGDFHVFTLRTRPAKAGTEVFLDGFKGGERDRAPSRIAMDQGVIGGRFYSNDPSQPPFAQGFFPGAIAEVVLYDRALPDEERVAMEQNLLGRIAGLNALLHGTRGHSLEPVKDPPIVQVLVPGFTVQELPLKIGNLNNVRYRHDGKLVAQAYDGRIYLLSDSDGDRLEDASELFWPERTLRSPIGIALTAEGDPRGDGVFVASKGKVSLILDKDRDGRADQEIMLATGWPEPLHSVDAMGLAVDPKDGSIYFGRGCANFVDPYLIDKATGNSQYRIDDERGTIQRISPDFSSREIICTGVRFTCALAFNRDGDLFATDQEGATWLPNGNPLDELLHIQRGKHYGFPPRHPKYLPDVVDEPAVFEYAPQHQSTVGMIFNEGVGGGPAFGPTDWRGDAIVCGESRGKLYRTRLVKTPLGYVARNQLFACLGLLTVDACVSPAGDLVVACHSGAPDWGTGPTGEGRVFKIRYTGTSVPQPVMAWAGAPDEFRIAFDRPLDPADWADAQKKVRIEAGAYAAAGDRFESIRPGYQVVRDQMASLRRWVDVLGLNLSEDRRTLILRVPRQSEPVTYTIALPVPASWRQPGGVPQVPEMDVAVRLDGVAANVVAGGDHWRTILPHPSLAVAAELTRGSSEHEQFLHATRQPGAILSMRAQVNVSNPFVPAIQPGSTLDWNPAVDAVASRKSSVETDLPASIDRAASGPPTGVFDTVELAGVTNPPAIANGLFLTDSHWHRALPLHQFRLPWVSDSKGDGPTNGEFVAQRTDVHGNWLRGRRIFFGDAACSTCHTLRGEGIVFGPDLSNLVHRDRESVLQDIRLPSAALNPDHPGYLVSLADGTVQSGLLRSADSNPVILALPAGAEMELAADRVRGIELMKVSLMPQGFDQQLHPDQMEDLLTFLLVNPLEPAVISRPEPPRPPSRTPGEIRRVLGDSPHPSVIPKTMRLLLVAGPKDHGLNEHDYPLWLERWSRLLALAENVEVATAGGFPTAAQLASADVAIFYNANPGWDAAKAALLDRFQERGGGAVFLHYAVNGGPDPAGVADRIGLAFTAGSRFRHGEFDLEFKGDNPITRGFPTLHLTDETYWNMRDGASRLNVLGTALEEKEPRPLLWTVERGRARIVGCIPGHFTWTFDDPLFRILVFRSICWAGRQDDIDRLADLATVGAWFASRANP